MELVLPPEVVLLSHTLVARLCLALPSVPCMAAGANLSVPTATMQLNLPQCPHPAAPRVLLGQKGAGRVGQPGRELSSSISLQLLQEPLMLHPYPSYCPPPLLELLKGMLVRKKGHMGHQRFLGHGAALEMGLISYQGLRSLRAGLHLLQRGMGTLPPSPITIKWGNLCAGLLLFTAEECPYGLLVL